MVKVNRNQLETRITEIVRSQAGIPDGIKDTLIQRLVRAAELAFLPEARNEGVTVMTEAASLAADKHLERRRGGDSDAGNGSDPKPKTL